MRFLTRLFAVFLLLLASTKLIAQSTRQLLDSLKLELSNAPTDQERSLVLSDLTWHYVPVSLDTAISFGEENVGLAMSLDDPDILSQAYSDLAYAYMEKGELLGARKNYQEALRIRYKTGDSTKIYGTITNLGSVYQRDFQSDSAMVNYLKALSFFERTGNERNADFVRNNIGVIYLEMRNYPKALEILKEVAEYRKANGEDYLYASTLTNIASIHKNQKNFEKAEETYLEALEIFQNEEDDYYTSTTYNNLATLYNAQGKSDLAISFAEKGLTLAEKVGADYDYALIESNLAKSYHDLKDYRKSRAYYLLALTHFKAQNAEDDVASMYLLMSPVYAALGMPDSSAYYTSAYVDLNKKLTEQEIQQLTTDLEARYQSEQKDAAIARQQLELRTKNFQLYGSLVLAVVLGLVGYLLYSQQKLKNRQLTQEGELKVALAQIETQNKLQEQRMLISRDLHDNIGAQLTFIISAIENLKYFDPIKDTLTHRYESIANFTKQTITELRDTIWAMNSGQITMGQLSARISDYLERAGISTRGINFEFELDKSLDPNFSMVSSEGIQIYRIVQEAIQNALKYAYPSQILVTVSQRNGDFNLSINDDGSGFLETEATAGNGLFNMRKRAEELGGSLQIISAKGQGTQVILSIPDRLA
ncbi:tetratricopeptide repeat protein [Algoriphagus halophytocola]|uniref:histidine kinase n=1 Tax=Algoriphagus halophytocola TaxID=2991499 RepID=A0ABY6MBV7_9BACT|nr:MULTISPECIES: tetratricopeptide repeat protein [unclassified Algoriphagus]UZD21126.1 tetratricopeptide repeat protein [Algoriphagus sp. TR-M5]WBL42295.1 tetratricopeptide repeat protein [Algoriphagus sp. TR-M9]